MGIPVMILGASGSGKSTSLRNLDPNKVVILNVAGKPMPFKSKDFKIADRATYDDIQANIGANKYKTYVIDDSQFLMAFEFMDKADEKGYQKFTDIAKNFYDMLTHITQHTSKDTIVYLLHHIDRGEDGKIKAKTIGKMLDEKLCLEGLFSVVLLADVVNGEYVFKTKGDGNSSAKAPMGMFETDTVPNDLAEVDKVIRAYWGLEEVADGKAKK